MTTTSNSYPYWVEIIQERITYHKDKRQFAHDTGDWDSADQHFSVIEELQYLLDSFGFNEEPE
jgi:hypothetical protein